MTAIPNDVYDALFDRLGHTLHEYDGLAEAVYAHELSKTNEAAQSVERPLFQSGVTMTLSAWRWGVVDRTKGIRTLFRPPANSI